MPEGLSGQVARGTSSTAARLKAMPKPVVITLVAIGGGVGIYMLTRRQQQQREEAAAEEYTTSEWPEDTSPLIGENYLMPVGAGLRESPIQYAGNIFDSEPGEGSNYDLPEAEGPATVTPSGTPGPNISVSVGGSPQAEAVATQKPGGTATIIAPKPPVKASKEGAPVVGSLGRIWSLNEQKRRAAARGMSLREWRIRHHLHPDTGKPLPIAEEKKREEWRKNHGRDPKTGQPTGQQTTAQKLTGGGAPTRNTGGHTAPVSLAPSPTPVKATLTPAGAAALKALSPQQQAQLKFLSDLAKMTPGQQQDFIDYADALAARRR